MILPIYTYGELILQKAALDVKKEDDKDLQELISYMYKTMYNANGSGLAAPQVGHPVNLIVIDAEIQDGVIFKGVFINSKILSYSGGTYTMSEGCLSLPGISAPVHRPGTIEIEYYDEKWKHHKNTFDGLPARILQHEYDHVIGKLFIDRLDILTKEKILLDLVNIKQKKIKTTYPIV